MENQWLPLVIRQPLVIGTTVLHDDLATRAESLKVVHTAWGGFWQLSFQIQGSQGEIEDWIDDGLGRDVTLHGPALDVIWEGFVSQVSGNIGSLSITRGPLLDTVANRVYVEYAVDESEPLDSGVVAPIFDPPVPIFRPPAPPPPALPANWYEDTDSQAKYGIIERVLTAGELTVTNAEEMAQTALEKWKEPQTDEKDNLESSASPSVTVTCLGYVHWLKAFTYTSAVGTTANASAMVQNFLGADPNSIFSTDYANVNANTSQVMDSYPDQAPAWDALKGVVSIGDSSYNRWLFGIGKDRKAYYSAAPTTTAYQRALAAPEQRLEVYGAGTRVYPWEARAARWTFYTDLLVGKAPAAERRSDPRFLFVEQATFTLPWGLTLDGSDFGKLDQALAKMGLDGEAG